MQISSFRPRAVTTPVQAAEHPVLDPAWQDAFLGGLNAAPTAQHVAVDSTIVAATTYDQSTVVAAGDDGLVAHGGGPVDNHWSLVDVHKDAKTGTYTWTESLTTGESLAALTFIPRPDGSVQIDGELGTVPVHLKSQATGAGRRTWGTLGTEPYEVAATGDANSLHAVGALDGAPIDTTYAISHDHLNGADVTGWAGQGSIAGQNQSVNVTLEVLPQAGR
jgi:hypothetical protein